MPRFIDRPLDALRFATPTTHGSGEAALAAARTAAPQRDVLDAERISVACTSGVASFRSWPLTGRDRVQDLSS
jgi:hypothetical protein